MRRRIRTLLAILFAVMLAALAATPAVLAQSAPESDASESTMAASCACVADFDELARRVEENYVGFILEVKGEKRAEYDRLKARLRQEAARTPGERCVFVLRELTEWFHDGHLFIVEAPPTDSAETRRLAATRERTDRDEAELRAYFDANSDRLDPVEGIWYDRGLRVAIVRDDRPGRDFVAITLKADADAWEPGMVKAELSKRDDGDYDVVLYAADHSIRHPYQATIRKGALLHMPPVMWGKAYPVTTREQSLLDPENPRAPTFSRVDERTVLFSIPSHDPQQARDRLAALVAAHRDEILAAQTLIIDIRGNEGGSSLTTRVLAPFYYSDDQRPPFVPDTNVPVSVASRDHIEDFTRTVARYPQPPAWMPRLLEAMKAHVGGLLPYPPELRSPPFRPDTVYAAPRHVAILMDRGVVSAGEAFVMEAGRSRKVTLFGENTGGVIDYQSVEVDPLACPARGLLLGYPTIAASADLPAGGLNRTGIPPDVRIDPAARDWIEFVVRYYRSSNR